MAKAAFPHDFMNICPFPINLGSLDGDISVEISIIMDVSNTKGGISFALLELNVFIINKGSSLYRRMDIDIKTSDNAATDRGLLY